MPRLDPQSVIGYTIAVIAKLTGSIDCFPFLAANRRNSMASPPHLKKIPTEYSQRTGDGMTSGIEALFAKARESIAAAQVLIKEYAETACEWAAQFISAAEVLLQRRK
jgi:hypothetical protein